MSRISELIENSSDPHSQQQPAPRVPPYRSTVYVPAHPVYSRNEDGSPRSPRVGIELLRSAAGERFLIAFTSLDRLVEALGPAQPWAAYHLGPFTELMHRAGLDPVHLDPALEPGFRIWQPEDVERFVGEGQ